MYRDFSEKSKENILNMVSQVENEKFSDFTDWIGDRWYDFESWIGTLNIKKYLNDVNTYHKKVIDKNNATQKTITDIFNAVNGVDSTYSSIFENLTAYLTTWYDYIVSLSDIVTPGNGHFSAEYMADKLKPILSDLEQSHIDCLRDKMVQDVNGELIFDEDLIYEYMKKNPTEMTDAEQALLLGIISQLKDTVAIYETLASMGDDELGADILTYVSWLSDSTKYDSFTAVSAHYNEIYVNLLNYMSEQSKDSNTFAASLVNIGIGKSVLSILGTEYSEDLGDIFGTNSFDVYLAKYVTEHSENYFLKLEASEEESLKASGKFSKVNDWLEDKLQKKGLASEDNNTTYYDVNGNIIDKKDAPTFYKRQITLAEIKKQVQASASIYKGTYDLGDWGEANVTVGEAEAHASVSAGLYVIGADGEKKFSPGVNAEVGASVTAFEAGWENQLLGDENFGLNADAKVTVGKAEAKADATAQIFGSDGKLDAQLGASAKAEAIAAEVEGSAGINVLGGEVGVKGSVNVGIGAHADVGYRDGVVKVDIGASLGVGASVALEVDVGGMVDTITDTATAAWEGVKSGWKPFTSWF